MGQCYTRDLGRGGNRQRSGQILNLMQMLVLGEASIALVRVVDSTMVILPRPYEDCQEPGAASGQSLSFNEAGDLFIQVRHTMAGLADQMATFKLT